MKPDLHAIGFGLLLILMVQGCTAATHPSAQQCSGASVPFPKAERVVSGWGSNTSVAVSGALRTSILRDFCMAGQELAAEKNLSLEQIDAVADKVLTKFQEKEADQTDKGRTMGSFLRAEFGAAGFAKPTLKQSVRVEMDYQLDVDQVRVGSEILVRANVFLLPPGKLHLEGLRAGATVCAGDLSLVLGQVARFSCAKVP